MYRQTKKNVFNITLINARSIRPKLDSFKKTIEELGSDVCLLTETWLKNTKKINETLTDFSNQHGYTFFRKDRVGDRRGGGVAICFKSETASFVKAKIPPSKHEVFAAIGRRIGQRRKIVAVVVYVPPYYNAEQNKSLLNYVNDVVLALKAKYDNPYVFVGGDFNKRNFRTAVRDHPEIKAIVTEATRGNAVLDILGSNVNDTLIDQGTVKPFLLPLGCLECQVIQ